MARAIVLECDRCEFELVVWDEAKPFYIDPQGHKRYAYHPSKERELCTALDVEHICTGCAHRFDVDSRAPVSSCPECKSTDIVKTSKLAGRACPVCKEGHIHHDPFGPLIIS